MKTGWHICVITIMLQVLSYELQTSKQFTHHSFMNYGTNWLRYATFPGLEATTFFTKHFNDLILGASYVSIFCVNTDCACQYYVYNDENYNISIYELS